MNIIGKKIYLNTFSKQDINDKYISWLNDQDVVRYSRQRFIKHTYKSCLKFYKSIIDENNNFLKINFLSDKNFIGTMTYIFNEDTVDIGILIGDKNYWNKKLGFEAWNLSINYLSTFNNIKKITAGCISENLAMKNIFKNSKMKYSHKVIQYNKYNKKFEKFIFYEIETK